MSLEPAGIGLVMDWNSRVWFGRLLSANTRGASAPTSNAIRGWFIKISSRCCQLSNHRRRWHNNMMQLNECQMVKNVKNMIQIQHFCLFHVLKWWMLQSCHNSTQIWCYSLLPFFSSSGRSFSGYLSHMLHDLSDLFAMSISIGLCHILLLTIY